MHLPWILWILGVKLDFYGFPNPWDHFNPVRIEKSSKLPQDLRQNVAYIAGNGSQTFGKSGFQHFDRHFTNQSPCFPENPDFHFLCLDSIFLFGGQISEASMFLEYRI